MLGTILCVITLTHGTHALECKAEYLHTAPDGTRYTSVVTSGQYVIGETQVVCSGEGHPVRVTMKDLGTVVCRAEVDIFSDGFESGSTSAWVLAVPQSRFAR